MSVLKRVQTNPVQREKSNRNHHRLHITCVVFQFLSNKLCFQSFVFNHLCGFRIFQKAITPQCFAEQLELHWTSLGFVINFIGLGRLSLFVRFGSYWVFSFNFSFILIFNAIFKTSNDSNWCWILYIKCISISNVYYVSQ